MKRRASGRVVVVSGASTGVGRALAVTFAENGDVVLLLSRNRKRLLGVRSRIGRGGGRSAIYACDVRSARSVGATAKRILQRFGRVDILINNAGVTYFKSVERTSIKEFDEVVETNLRGAFLLTKAFLPAMLRRRRGTILTVVSHAAKAIYTWSGAYTASKRGVEGLMNVLRAETRDRGLRVVNIYPGAVLTSIWQKRHRTRYGHRMLTPEQVAHAVYLLTVQPDSMMTEEIVLRPQRGDVKV